MDWVEQSSLDSNLTFKAFSQVQLSQHFQLHIWSLILMHWGSVCYFEIVLLQLAPCLFCVLLISVTDAECRPMTSFSSLLQLPAALYTLASFKKKKNKTWPPPTERHLALPGHPALHHTPFKSLVFDPPHLKEDIHQDSSPSWNRGGEMNSP